MELTPQSPRDAAGPKRALRRVRNLLALPIAAIVLSGCTLPSFGAFKSDTKTGQSTYHLWQWFSVGAIVIGGFTLLLMAYVMIRYRRRSDSIPKQTQYHLPLEITYTIIPILIVIGLFVSTVVVENKVTANPPTNVKIDVNAFQWGWKFTYPGYNAVVVGQTTQAPTMEMPVNTNVHISLTSSDVIHGFYVPKFNFSRYALPGVDNIFTFDAINTGTFFGQCSQLCGLYHSLMWFHVKVVTMSQYKAWLASFNTPAGIAAAKAANEATNQQTSTGVATKNAYGGS